LFAREIIMTVQASAGRIEAHDIEELQQVVEPWEVILRQISPGKLHARMDYVQVNGIVLYRERWSHRLLATGATPKGFFFFGGNASSKQRVGWCGVELGADCLAFGRSSTEIDFVTPETEAHICLLVPEHLMLRYLGEELTTQGLANSRFLACTRGAGAFLLQTMERILDKYWIQRDLLTHERTRQALEWQLMGCLVEFLLTRREESTAACTRRASRYRIVRRAIELCESVPQPISVPDLADACGVSKRVLELGFQKTVRTTPSQLMRQSRLNRVRRELRTADRASVSVTEILSRAGVSEFGRFAVEYKNLFGESPSTTLGREFVVPDRRLTDALART
jgi:AraC-like DNA-binding protein